MLLKKVREIGSCFFLNNFCTFSVLKNFPSEYSTLNLVRLSVNISVYEKNLWKRVSQKFIQSKYKVQKQPPEVFCKKRCSRLATLLKRDSDTGVFLWIAKLVRTPFLQNTSRRLLLKVGTFIINILVKVVGRYLSSSKFSCSQKQSSLKQLSLVVEDVLKNTLQL